MHIWVLIRGHGLFAWSSDTLRITNEVDGALTIMQISARNIQLRDVYVEGLALPSDGYQHSVINSLL